MPGETVHPLLPQLRVYLVYAVVPGLLWFDAKVDPEVDTWAERLLSESDSLNILASTVIKPVIVGMFIAFISWLASWYGFALLFPLRRIHFGANCQLFVPLLAGLLIGSTVLALSLDVPTGTHRVLRNWSPVRVLVDIEELYMATLLTCGYMHCISMTAQVIILTYCRDFYAPESWAIFEYTEEPRTVPVPLIRVVSEKHLLQEVKVGESRSGISNENDDSTDGSTSFIEEDELAEKPWGSVIQDEEQVIEDDLEDV